MFVYNKTHHTHTRTHARTHTHTHTHTTLVLDEASCALSEANEHIFYTSLQQLGITVMSVGHRSSLRKVSVGHLDPSCMCDDDKTGESVVW